MKQLKNLSSRPQAPPLNHLPDPDLVAIFSHFPVAELLNRKALNVRLEELQAVACRARRKLTLLIGPDARNFDAGKFSSKIGVPFNKLALAGLTMSDADRLLRQMPRLRELILLLRRVQEAEVAAIVRLLRGWSGSLRKLFILIFPSDDASKLPDAPLSTQLLRLLAGINSLSHLKKICFYLDGHLLPAGTEEQQQQSSLYLPVLGHLQIFTFESKDSASILKDSLTRYLPGNEALAILRIDNAMDEATFQWFLKAGPRVAASLRTFTATPQWLLTHSQLGRLCRTFQNLRELAIQGIGYTLPAVVRLLRSLNNLHKVTLTFNELGPEIDAIDGLQRQLQVGSEEVLVELKQVTYLEMRLLKVNSHQNLASLRLELFFPNITDLDIKITRYDCAICGGFGEVQGRQDRPEDWPRMDACCREIVTNAIHRQRFPLLEHVTNCIKLW